MAGVIAKLFRNLETTNQAGRQTGRRFAFRDLNCWLNYYLAAMEVIDQQERYECKKN
jgi:hypothetical protein